MSLVRKVKLLALVSILTMASMTTAYAKTDNKQDKTVKQTTTATKQEQESKDKSFERVKEVLGDLALYVEEPEEGTAQYCFDNKLSFQEISAEKCTKRLTEEEWGKLFPHLKGKAISSDIKHSSVAVVHIPNINSLVTNDLLVSMWKLKDEVSAIFAPVTQINYVVYFKDGKYEENSNLPKDKNLDDISFITFQVIAKESNTPIQLIIFPHHFESKLILGKDGVPYNPEIIYCLFYKDK